MGPNKVTFEVPDIYDDIQRLINELKLNISVVRDSRYKALLITSLEQAQLWSLKMVNA